MYKKLLILAFLLLVIFGQKSYGQCPSVDLLTLTTQTQVDAFLTEYPNCTEFDGSIRIGGIPANNSIENLIGLQNIQTIAGFLKITYNNALLNLSGLENLTSIGEHLWVAQCPVLTNINDLSNLDFLGGGLLLGNNDVLTSLNGLNNLTTINENVSVSHNDLLTNLSGLENLTSIGGVLSISGNTLESISSLSNLTSIGGDLNIEENGIALTSLNGLENLTSIGGSLNVKNNEGLTSLNGLNNLTTIGDYFIIYNNNALTSITGLNNLTSISAGLEILGNTALESLSILNNLVTIGDYLILRHNALLTNISSFENLTSIGGELSIDHIGVLNNVNSFENLKRIGGDLAVETGDWLSLFSMLDSLTYIGGDLDIEYYNGLTSINGMNQLDSIGGKLNIEDNGSLLNINGFESLTYIGEDLTIYDNENLSTINGFNNLIFIGDDLNIRYNEVLGELIGFNNLTSIGIDLNIQSNYVLTSLPIFESLTSIGGDLAIKSNEELTTLSDFNNLTSIGGNFDLINNDVLVSMSGLDNLSFIGGNLSIYNNSNLSFCSIPPVCSYLANGPGSIEIFENATGCDDENEVGQYCFELGKIKVNGFYDLNENTVQDSNEPYLPFLNVSIDPTGYTLYSDPTNGGVKYLSHGDYTISLDENDLTDWTLTTANSVYNITLDSINNCDTLYFGLFPNTYNSNLSTSYTNSLPRCNEFVTVEPLAINNGTTIASGTLWLDIDPAILAISYLDTPDTLDGDNRVGWYFTDLYPANTFKRKISLQFPGPPAFPIGDLLNFNTQVNYEDENGSHSNVLTIYRVEVQCSYDPNDKLVSPQYPENYALSNENLIYTIRFQNTGNAEAYDVVIKDLLSEDLDLSTFQYISSSHEEVLSTYIDDRMLTFEFKDIFLPDSTTNFDESQGYVMYSIRALDTLSDFSTIENTANIFFDYNPAVVTNTTENTMLSTFDFDEDGFLLWDDCDDNNTLVNNGATEIPYNGLDDDCDELTLDDDLDQDGFGIAEDCDDEDPLINSEVEEIPNNGIDEDCDGGDAIVSTKNILTIKPQIFPNPTSGLLQIKFSKSIEGTYEVRNLNGQLIFQGSLKRDNSIDLASQVQGVYLLLLKTEEGVWMERVVKL